jgi:hypothetical protein
MPPPAAVVDRDMQGAAAAGAAGGGSLAMLVKLFAKLRVCAHLLHWKATRLQHLCCSLCHAAACCVCPLIISFKHTQLSGGKHT